MKTKKVIELLQKADPSGEEEVCVGNADIFSIHKYPAYYDGCLQVLKRDWDNPFYNVIGAKYTSGGYKVQISIMNIGDALLDDPDLPVEVVDDFINKRMQMEVDDWRKEAEEINKEIENEIGEE